MPRGSANYGRADINFRSFFQDFNMSKFVVYSSLLIFSMLFALKLDRILNWSWWSIFIPLFIWKAIAGQFWMMKFILMIFKEFFFSFWSHCWICSLVEKTSNPSQCWRIHSIQSYAYKFSHTSFIAHVWAFSSWQIRVRPPSLDLGFCSFGLCQPHLYSHLHLERQTWQIFWVGAFLRSQYAPIYFYSTKTG